MAKASAYDVVAHAPRQDVAQLLWACDLFLFPSTNEGLPVSLIEAQAAGLPIVMSDSVTDELCVCKDIVRVKLSDPEEEWAQKALRFKNCERKNHYESMRSAGWDIEKAAEFLVMYYCR